MTAASLEVFGDQEEGELTAQGSETSLGARHVRSIALGRDGGGPGGRRCGPERGGAGSGLGLGRDTQCPLKGPEVGVFWGREGREGIPASGPMCLDRGPFCGTL